MEIAVQLDLTDIDRKNLYIYSYDKETNSYQKIEDSACWVDANGYVRFSTGLADDIIISEGPLEKK